VQEARALTVRQPWACAIVHGEKDVENRSWPTKYRGTLLIHAGQAFERAEYATVERLSTTRPPAPQDFLRGAIIGVTQLVDCVRDSTSSWAEAEYWHWCLRDARALEPSFSCSGKLGLWRPPEGLDW
jgi:hypothetical protein